MPKRILSELENRIEKLKTVEEKILANEVEKRCIQSRRLELESIKSYISEIAQDNNKNVELNNQDFWNLIDEF